MFGDVFWRCMRMYFGDVWGCILEMYGDVFAKYNRKMIGNIRSTSPYTSKIHPL
jgi:hypothetical protein